jgi:hypothetical protein
VSTKEPLMKKKTLKRTKKSAGHGDGFVRCHHSHKELSLGGGAVLGASCCQPREGYDIYIGFDHGMKRFRTFPWDSPTASKVVEVYFPIPDGGVPEDVAEFKRMVAWIVAQLALGKRIHMGCIGGHGRTGMVLAAIVSHVLEPAGAGKWVRANYCKTAIETTEQVEFLKSHFGISPVEASRDHYTSKTSNWSYPYYDPKPDTKAANFSPMKGYGIWSKCVSFIDKRS